MSQNAENLSSHVLDIFAAGLALKERVDHGDSLLLDVESAGLKQMLFGDGSVRGHVDYGDTSQRPVPSDSNEFLGIRYALTCWLDEIFISDPACPWSMEWKEKSLESQIYGGTQQRAWRFWTQAELAEKRPGTDAVEAYMWCVMLGFRGSPGILNPQEYLERVRRRVLTAKQQEFRLPADLGLKTNVPPLRGRDKFRSSGRLLLVSAALALFVGAAAIVRLLNR